MQKIHSECDLLGLKEGMRPNLASLSTHFYVSVSMIPSVTLNKFHTIATKASNDTDKSQSKTLYFFYSNSPLRLFSECILQ